MRSRIDVLREFTDCWASAERRGDVSLLRDLLDDDFLAVAADGTLFDKRAWLARYHCGDLVNDGYQLHTVSLSVRRGFGLVAAHLAQTSSYQGHDASGDHTAPLVVALPHHRVRLPRYHMPATSPPQRRRRQTVGRPRGNWSIQDVRHAL